ncbi:MAG: oxygen-insensitive NADPH nitroreductase [Bacillaceae bacterium]|nr:oxygen-insensitive NADPH nitroreductase [Bacillaceae bacterium]
MNRVFEVMSNHRSVRKFEDKPINDQVLNDIFQVSQWASTSNNLQAYSVITVRDPLKKEKLALLTGNQKHVIECPVFLIFCADLHKSLLCTKIEKKKGQFDTIEPFIVATVDVALYAQNVMLAAESEGLGGVYIGGIRNKPADVCELLNIPDHVYPVFGMCLGYPDEMYMNEQKPRLPLRAIVHNESYQTEEELIQEIDVYNSTMRDYYASRKNGNRSYSWSESVTDHFSEPKRLHLGEFLKSKKFGLK